MAIELPPLAPGEMSVEQYAKKMHEVSLLPDKIAAIIRYHHSTHVRHSGRSNEPRRTFHQGDEKAAEEIMDLLREIFR